MDNQIYFNQTNEWADFWIQANGTNHNIYFVETDYMSCYIYEYPFMMGKKFWYIPRGFILKKPDVIKLLSTPSKNISGQTGLTDEIFANINSLLNEISAKARNNPDISTVEIVNNREKTMVNICLISLLFILEVKMIAKP